MSAGRAAAAAAAGASGAAGDRALDLDIRLDRGGLRLRGAARFPAGITALFGPSGAGKTTLLRCVAGILRPDAGRITLGEDVLFDSARGIHLAPERRRVGVVFQDLRLFPHLTVAGNLRFGRGAVAGSAEERRVLELLGIGGLLDRRPSTLSGGEARRVALGRALLASPRVLLLDEPTAGLDPARRDAALGLIAQVHAELGLPIVFVSHSLPEILQLTTRLAVVEDGALVAQGELHDVLGQDRVFRLAHELGLESVLEVVVEETDREAGYTLARLGDARLALPPVDAAPGRRALVAVRPEDVLLARGPVEGISAQNALAGDVEDITDLADRRLVTVRIGGRGGGLLRAEITPRASRDLGLALGGPVTCLIKVFSFRWRRHLG